jgi:hypothetical protein
MERNSGLTLRKNMERWKRKIRKCDKKSGEMK